MRKPNLLTNSLKLKAEAYQYQVLRFGNYKPQKPLKKAIARAKAFKVTSGLPECLN